MSGNLRAAWPVGRIAGRWATRAAARWHQGVGHVGLGGSGGPAVAAAVPLSLQRQRARQRAQHAAQLNSTGWQRRWVATRAQPGDSGGGSGGGQAGDSAEGLGTLKRRVSG